MALTLQTAFSTPEAVPTGFTAQGSNPIKAAGGIGVATTPSEVAYIAKTALLNADQEAAMDLVFTSFQWAAVFGKCPSNSSPTADRYYVVVRKTVGAGPDTIAIVKRAGGLDSTLATANLMRGKIISGDQIKIRIIEAGTATVVEAYFNTIRQIAYVDRSSPLQGGGYCGAMIGDNSSGMGIDNFYAGNLSVYWVANGTGSNPAHPQSGLDSGVRNGSFAEPWATIKYGGHKSRMAATGAVLMVRAGNYPDRLNDSFSDILWRSGTDANNPATYSSFPGENAIITADTDASVVGIGFVSNGEANTNHVQFHDIIQDGQGNTSSGFQISYRNSYIRFISCVSRNSQGNGWVFAQLHNANDNANHHHELIKCEASGSANTGSHGVYDQVSGTMIEGGYWHTNNPNPSGTGAWGLQHNTSALGQPNQTVQTTGIIYRFNRITNNGGGITVGGTDNALIMGNLVWRNNNTGGISISGFVETPITVPSGTMIFNNTLYRNNTDIGAAYPIRIVVGATGTICKNNILFGNLNGKTGIVDDGTGSDILNNLNPTKDAGSETDPVFKDVTLGSEDFRLQAGSPCIGAALNLGPPYNLDFDGFTRPAVGLWSQGAFEYQPEVAFAGAVKGRTSSNFTMGFGL